MLDADDVVVASPDNIRNMVGDVLVLLQPDTGRFYSTNAVGARIFELLAEPWKVADLCAAVASEFDVDTVSCRADVTAFVEQMIDRGLAVRSAQG